MGPLNFSLECVSYITLSFFGHFLILIVIATTSIRTVVTSFLPELSRFSSSAMDETKFDQLIAVLDAGQQWQCELLFPVGSEEVVNLCEYMHRDFLGEHARTVDVTSFPSTSRFRFPPDRYGDGINSVDTLRKDLVAATKQSGFVLVTFSSVLKRTGVTPYIIFSCS